MARSTWSRRDLLCAAGALATLTFVRVASAKGAPGPAGRTGRFARRAAPTRPPELVPGMKLGPCKLTRLLPVERDALPFELQDPSGELFVVEAHRRDESRPGIARAGSLDVYLVNGGDGRTPTDEARGLGAMALARVLAVRERAGLPVPQVATIVERWNRHPPPTL
jgi:hypothetical protein